MNVPCAIHFDKEHVEVFMIAIGVFNVTTKMSLCLQATRHSYKTTCLSTPHEYYNEAEQVVSAISETIHGNFERMYTPCRVSVYQSTVALDAGYLS